MMLEMVAKALAELAAKGETMIVTKAATGEYAGEASVYVLDVLRGLKCEFESINLYDDILIKLIP